MLRLVLSYLTNYANYFKPSYPAFPKKHAMEPKLRASAKNKEKSGGGDGCEGRIPFLPGHPFPLSARPLAPNHKHGEARVECVDVIFS